MASARVRSVDREELLRHLRLCYWRTLNRLDEELEDCSLTARQYLLLKAVDEEGPLNARAICQKLLVTPADVTGLANRLERKKFLQRIRSIEDRRRVILEITPSGRKALLRARRQRDRLVDSMIHAVPATEFRATMRGLGKLLHALDASMGRRAQLPRTSGEAPVPALV